jgi:hypothetical protein
MQYTNRKCSTSQCQSLLRGSIFGLILISQICQGANQIAIRTSASSVLGNKASYSHTQVIDNDFSTAWVAEHSGNGTKEWIQLDFGKIMDLQQLGVMPGYVKYDAKTGDLWEKNSRLFQATLEFSDGTKQLARFHDRKFLQFLNIEKKTSFVKIVVDSVYQGSRWSDLCITEIVPVFDSSRIFAGELMNHDGKDTVKFDWQYFIGPIEIRFSKGGGERCGQSNIIMLNDTLYLSKAEEVDFNGGAKFSLYSTGVSSIQVEERHEYRYGYGGFSESEGPLFFTDSTKPEDESSFFTKWRALKPGKGIYTVIDSAVNNITAFAIHPKINKADVKSYLIALRHNDPSGIRDDIIGLNWENHIWITEYSIQLRFTYLTADGSQKRIVVRFCVLHGEC